MLESCRTIKRRGAAASEEWLMHFAWNKPLAGGILRQEDLAPQLGTRPVWHILYGGGSVTGTRSELDGLDPGWRPDTQ